VQAQRIYLELQRRSLIRQQSSQATFNNMAPRGFPPYASTPPNGGLSPSQWSPSTGLVPGTVSQNQIATPAFASPNQFHRGSPLQAGPSHETAPTWHSGDATNQAIDQENFSLQTVAGETPQAPQSISQAQLNATQSIAPSVAQPPVLVLDRQLTPPVPQVELKSSGWRPALTPLPVSFIQRNPATSQTAERAPVSISAQPLALNPENDGAAQPSAPAPSADPTTLTDKSDLSNVASKRGQKVVDNSQITPMHPMELASQPASDATQELPNIPVRPAPDMPSPAPEVAERPGTQPAEQEPSAFVPPATASERRIPADAPQPTSNVVEPPGVVTLPSVAPPTLPLSPRAVPKTPTLQSESEPSMTLLDSAARLAKQTDDIRIIPGHRGAGNSRLEDLLNVAPTNSCNNDSGNKDSSPSDQAFDPPTAGWKSYMPLAPAPSAHDSRQPADAAPVHRESADDAPTVRKQIRGDSAAESSDAFESRRSRSTRTTQRDEERLPEPKPAFNLAALVKDPEFREIHTQPVLDGLELLSQTEPRHRLLGASRICMSGPEARTALPALRQLLVEEPNAAVRLRIADAILRLLPNDRTALETLSHLLVDPTDADLRQAAAAALGGAGTSGNPTAIVRLTDALDDSSPRVRIMAALSLAQFGTSASDAVPRLEMAATNDVPRMQRAALAALTSIRGLPNLREAAPAPTPLRGLPNYQEAAPVPTPFVDSRPPVTPPIAAPIENSPVPTSPIKAKPVSPATKVVDQRDFQKPAIVQTTAPPNPPKPVAAPTRVETKTVAAEASGPPELWPTIPARGISLNEIESDGASTDARPHPQPEPVRLPEVPARPLERSVEKAKPRPPKETPKPAVVQPPLTDDSPLNLESQAGGAKPGSTK
jgi:hypothetical protein